MHAVATSAFSGVCEELIALERSNVADPIQYRIWEGIMFLCFKCNFHVTYLYKTVTFKHIRYKKYSMHYARFVRYDLEKPQRLDEGVHLAVIFTRSSFMTDTRASSCLR